MHHQVKVGIGGIHMVEFGMVEVVHGNSQRALGKSETQNDVVNMCSHIPYQGQIDYTTQDWEVGKEALLGHQL